MERLGTSRPDIWSHRLAGRVALLLGIGFTLPVLALDTALDGGEVAEAARLGLADRFAMGLMTLVLTRR